MYKKIVQIIVFIFLILMLTACDNVDVHKNIENSDTNKSDSNSEVITEKGNVEVEVSDKVSIIDINKEEYYKFIDMNNYIVSLAYNTNIYSTINRTVSIFGEITTSDTPGVVKDFFSNKYSKIILYSDDEKIATASSYNVKTFISGKNCGFELLLDLENSCFEEKSTSITSIKFEQKDGYSYEIKTNNYYVTNYSEMENYVKVIDSPISFTSPVNVNTSREVSYTFLTANKDYNKDFDVDIILPNGFDDFIEIESIQYYFDDNMKKDVEDILKNDMTLQQKKDLKVITINVRYKKLKDSTIVIQPLIKLNITGDYQVIGPYLPLIF